jgi:hypothetical protein
MFQDRKRFAKCPVCDCDFSGKLTQVYCSKQCAGKATRNRLGTKKGVRKHKNLQEERLKQLRLVFKFTTCMVRGCNYCKTFDIHRIVQGKDGGKYEVGNMFAICPNHHAEVHRGIIKLIKISDYELLAEEIRK